MSLGRSFHEIMSVFCPLQITLMGPSIKYVSDKREEVKECHETPLSLRITG